MLEIQDNNPIKAKQNAQKLQKQLSKGGKAKKLPSLHALKAALDMAAQTSPKPAPSLLQSVPGRSSVPKARKGRALVEEKEKQRFSQILQHPAFQAQPRQTIFQHLKNTIQKEKQAPL